jgi:DNA-binding transcriptional regulator YiaG
MHRKRPNVKFNVLALRKKLGLTQVELAEKIGTDARSVYRWETTGTKPRGPAIKMLQALEKEHLGDRATAPPMLRGYGIRT